METSDDLKTSEVPSQNELIKMEKTRRKATRKRKKKLFSDIRKQMEFYLSDANLRKDRFMKEIMSAAAKQVNSESEGNFTGTEEVALTVFLTFNRIKSLGVTAEDIRKAITSSTLLEVSPNGSHVKRKYPVDFNKDIDSCTLYVENLPKDISHDRLHSLFSRFGVVTYISLPRFPGNQQPKGFAFIEFENELNVRSACLFFGAQVPKSREDKVESTNKDRKCQEESKADDRNTTKRKLNESLSDQPIAKKSKNEELTPTKKALTDELAVLNLRAMSKQEWIEWKKKYTRLQKDNMKNVKNSIRSIKTPTTGVAAEIAAKLANLAQPGSVKPKTASEGYVKGCILTLKIRVHEGFNETIFRNHLRTKAGQIRLAYIDLASDKVFLPDGGIEQICYIRCHLPKDSQSLLNSGELKEFGELSILEGTQEEEYWKKIHQQQQEVKAQKDKKKSKNGYNRWVRKVADVAKHLTDKTKVADRIISQ